MTIRFEVRDRLREDYSSSSRTVIWLKVSRSGQRWQHPEDSSRWLELFRIGVLAEALDRSSQAIKKWEKEKLIPRPLFRPQGEKCTHWYTGVQIVNLHRLMRYRYAGKKYLQEREEFERFIADVNRVWYADEIVVREDGLIAGIDFNVAQSA